MSLLINSVISALDKPTSLTPFFVKDSLDNIGKTYMASKAGGKHEARERFIEETGTSIFWIGGIPAIRKLSSVLFKNKFDSDIHFKRINTKGVQSYFADELKNGDTLSFSKKDLEGINLKSKNLEEIQKKLTDNGFVANKSLGKYGKYHIGTSIAAVAVNFVMLTAALPAFNHLLSKKIISKEQEQKQEPEIKKQENLNKQNPSFKGIKDFIDFKNLFNFTKLAENAQLNPTSSMLLLDYGISGSRVTFVPRNNQERIEYIINEGGILLFFYYAADWIKKGFEKIANNVFKAPIDLDYKILADKDFENILKNQKTDLTKFPKENPNEINIIKFIDSELKDIPQNTKTEDVFKNPTLKLAQKTGLLDVEYDEGAKSWIRHSKKYIETDKIAELNKNLQAFSKKITNEKDIKNLIQKAKYAKVLSVVGNIGICTATLSILLPKLKYIVRKKMTNSLEAPGITEYKKDSTKV